MSSSNQMIRCSFKGVLLILCITTRTWSLEFNYTNFHMENSSDFIFTNSSSIADGALQITPNHGDPAHQSGRVFYKDTFKLHRNNGSTITSINSTFIFNIRPLTQPGGEGFAFILTNNPDLPSNSSGQWLGIVNNKTNNVSRNQIVAVEFDTRKSFAEDLDDNHVGLDVNGIKSVGQLTFSSVDINISAGTDVGISISFDAASSSFVLFAAMLNGASLISSTMMFSWTINLAEFLSEDVWVGFSASTSNFTQLNQIKYWYFNSTDIENIENTVAEKKGERLLWLLVLFVGLPVFAACLYWKKKDEKFLRYNRKVIRQDIEIVLDDCSKRPIKFQLKQLKQATANFDPKRQLGRGGFGTVYRGYLQEYGMEVAVKRVFRNSNRGEREFIAEVTTISQLLHRNLVKLIGWCNDDNELLLVYEFLQKGSLEKYLFENGSREDVPVLNWATRYKIICGVASALDYLHHGGIKRVLHRDIKASNVMLDDEYNARLGDFGLARAMEHDSKSHHSTVAVAGTRGYMAPECYFTGRASPETDVYAFGVFAMEVACGRKPGNYVQSGDELDESTGSSYIVDWLWDLHGIERILDAADERLKGEYDEEQMESVLRLALACCHPNHPKRPSMRMALQVLSGGALPPNPVAEKPAFMWPVMKTQSEVEMPSVGLLFTGGYMSRSSISGR
ncbi:putative L-type lectin-domain containing receptor kinase S.5 [Canna indica]|uniref:non-specific serine/threonine protein kinase n=1 Tax=Canna indica TaxID=4628 RepID=A0AAQ3Q7G5_9LILI|nr:putative L-type lectin-domain containing receptor kinase S.5 [Canna indica]